MLLKDVINANRLPASDFSNFNPGSDGLAALVGLNCELFLLLAKNVNIRVCQKLHLRKPISAYNLTYNYGSRFRKSCFFRTYCQYCFRFWLGYSMENNRWSKIPTLPKT